MSDLVLALQITALAMGLVFGAIILLWGMMNLLTSITAEKGTPSSPGADVPDSSQDTPGMESELEAQVAVAAVAVALAEQQLSSAHPLSEPPTAIVSAWQLGMRTRQMYQKGGSIKCRAG